MPIIRTDEQVFDIRLVDRHIMAKRIRQKDYDKYLKSLEDVEENSDYITAELIFDFLAEPKEETDEDSESDEVELDSDVQDE